MDVGQISPEILESIHAQPMQWMTALGELCDNSFDAGAGRIAICFEPKKGLTVTDDGAGCDNIEKMLTLGDHYHQSTTKLGRWGVGLKEAACWLWGELQIETVFKGTRHKACIDWGKLSKQDHWIVPDPISSDAKDGQGTSLRFRNTVKSPPSDPKRICEELGYIFAPALKSGRQIAVKYKKRKPILCTAWELPDFEETVQERFEINGKRVHLKAGIVAMGATNPRKGFSFIHAHRIICNSGLGSNGLSVSRICGIVELDTSWTLGKNKTEIVDTDQEELEGEIFKRCERLLLSAASQAEILRNSALEEEVSGALRTMLQEQSRREKREKGTGGTGAVSPKGSGRRRRKARQTQPGEGIDSRCNVGQMRMEWEAGGSTIGRVDLPGNCVYLNESHARLSRHRLDGNTGAIVDHCMNLLAYEVFERGQRDRFPFSRDHETFVDALSHVLNGQQLTDDASAAQMANT